jgi:hypothetical protein
MTALYQRRFTATNTTGAKNSEKISWRINFDFVFVAIVARVAMKMMGRDFFRG